MTAKVRTPLVVALSSIIISGVLTLTIFGFYAYLEWKEKDIRRNYRRALYALNTKLFEKYISVNAVPKLDSGDMGRERIVVAGTIKNNSKKTIYSLKLRAAFYGQNGQLLHEDTFYPVGIDFDTILDIGNITKSTRNFLLEGDSVSFKRLLANCPAEVYDYFKTRAKLAKVENPKPVRFEYKLEGLDIK